MSTETAVMEAPAGTTAEAEYIPEPTPTAPDASLRDILARSNAQGQAEASLSYQPAPDPNAPIPIDAPADPTVELEAVPDAPLAAADELTQLRAQNAFYEEMFGADLLKQAEPATPAPAATQDTQQDLLAPMELSFTDEELDKAYLEGDKETIRAMEKRRYDVLDHNQTLKLNQNLAKAVAWYMPVAIATSKFHERNPEFAMMPKAGDIIGAVLPELRMKHPTASEVQIVHLAEKQLSPLIKRAKSIIAQQGAGARVQVGASQQPAGAQPQARAVMTTTPTIRREPTTQERIEQLRKHAAGE